MRNKEVRKILVSNIRIFDCLGMLPLEHVLYPRTGATVAAITALKDRLDAVYDVTIMYNQTYDNDRQVRLAAPSMIGKKRR